MSGITLHEAVISRVLETAGLPALASVQAMQTGNPPTVDPYAAPASAVTQLSGYGQLLAAADRAVAGTATVAGSGGNYAASSALDTVTAQASTGATAGSYAIEVSQVAQAQVSKSTAVFADADADVFTPGSFTIAKDGGETFTVNVAGSSLNSLASAINASGAGVTAVVESGEFGQSLKVTGNATGAGQGFSFSAPPSNPFDQWGSFLAQLGMTTTQTAQDAAYTVGGVAGTSAVNTGIALAENTSFDILKAGSATVTVSASPTIGATLSEVTTAATKLVQQYNALQGTTAQLTGASGALSGDALALQLMQQLHGAADQPALASIGLAATGQNDPLTLDTTALTTAFNNDASGTAALLTNLASTLHSLISGYAGNSGSILGQARTVEEGMSFMNGSPASAYANVSGGVKQYLLESSLASAASPSGLPAINVFA